MQGQTIKKCKNCIGDWCWWYINEEECLNTAIFNLFTDQWIEKIVERVDWDMRHFDYPISRIKWDIECLLS